MCCAFLRRTWQGCRCCRCRWGGRTHGVVAAFTCARMLFARQRVRGRMFRVSCTSALHSVEQGARLQVQAPSGAACRVGCVPGLCAPSSGHGPIACTRACAKSMCRCAWVIYVGLTPHRPCTRAPEMSRGRSSTQAHFPTSCAPPPHTQNTHLCPRHRRDTLLPIPPVPSGVRAEAAAGGGGSPATGCRAAAGRDGTPGSRVQAGHHAARHGAWVTLAGGWAPVL